VCRRAYCGVDLRSWIADEHATVLARFDQTVASVVPRERWTDPVGAGGASIAWLAFHSSYHEDLAVNAVLRGAPTVLSEMRDRLGLAGVAAGAGLGEREQPELSAALDLEALDGYVRAVHAATQEWLGEPGFDVALGLADAGGADGLSRAGIAEAEVPWLSRLWAGKPASFFVQWEAIGHRINHVGEMVSVRNRMGLSPF
jgi:hypothetical protein